MEGVWLPTSVGPVNLETPVCVVEAAEVAGEPHATRTFD